MNKLVRLLRFDWPLHFILLLTNWLPDNVIFIRMRGALARHFLGSCGSNLRLGRNITFYNPSNIHLGKDIYIAYGCWFNAGEKISIGNEVIFGPYCIVVSTNHSRQTGSFRYGALKLSPIKIGYGCWIGSHVTITPGSEISNGSCIGAGALVTGKIPSGVLAGGIPARVLKEFD
ncbi:MAG: acyltransferase [Legionellales bacterium]